MFLNPICYYSMKGVKGCSRHTFQADVIVKATSGKGMLYIIAATCCENENKQNGKTKKNMFYLTK